LPSEDEWYKAAYHKNDGKTGNYWDYPTSTNDEPYSDDPASLDYPANSANYWNDDYNYSNGVNDGCAVASPYLTNVGAYALSVSPYGTLDQGGNVLEWNEADVWDAGGSSRNVRGGAWGGYSYLLLASYRNNNFVPSSEGGYIGFRVAIVPEPAGVAMLLGIAVTALLYWWRKRASVHGIHDSPIP
jgi:formylglycine-generating enzyme